MQNYSSSNPRPTVGSSTYIIAEMACAHEGNMGLGKKIIDAAGRGGASAIQFQIWSLADMVVPQHSDYDKLAKIQLSRGEWSILASYARNQYPEMQIIACVYEGRSVDFAEEIELDAYKIHSSDLSNPYLVRHVAGTGKRIDLSVGASTLDEIQTAVGWIKSISSQEIWLMYGYQSFPTCTDDV
ncbi:MAG: N-acetylneuraminate synthase family protein, partial [Thermodesulfobacteriota bacterium]|nr:N-acetylneuraminate synthase family protein [Thermodesulfobacteriota bacterium]